MCLLNHKLFFASQDFHHIPYFVVAKFSLNCRHIKGKAKYKNASTTFQIHRCLIETNFDPLLTANIDCL